MSKIEVDQITQQSGTTLTVGGGACKTAAVDATTVTIGRSGGTVTLTSGATQSGFGRTGTVDWQTTKKTASFTAVNGEGYFVDSSSSAITVTLPASPSAGNIVSVSDYNGSAGTNTITIARNGSNINGDSSNFDITKADSAITFVYVDATVGWTSIQTSSTSDVQSPFIVASGGTETTCGDFKIHTFTGPGTFTVSKVSCTPAENTVGYLVVAGGGGSSTSEPGDGGGGGGAGGYREGRNVPIDNFTASPLVANAPTNAVTLTATSFPITVGAGGAGMVGTRSAPGGSEGAASVFSTITSAGGGGAGAANNGPNSNGHNGGSGGGGSGGGSNGQGLAGSGNTPSVSPPQGQDGGRTDNAVSGPTNFFGGGGGGAGASGGNASPGGGGGGAGGNGVSSSITGASVTRAGGGGTSSVPGRSPSGSNTSGGSGGGGDGGGPPTGNPGTANTGGGGGTPAAQSNPAPAAAGGNGGSGIVIIRYKFQ